ncbi:MAG: Mth938-like domain-containing protein [Aeromicrobium sp.]|nr:Mth938-like domain-containing protein [Burkholderiales bacterium]
MKLHLHDVSGQNAITGHGAEYVQINGARIANPLIVAPDALISPWAAPAFESLVFADFSELLALKPTLVVFGSGATFRFPAPQILAAFSQARIGFEVMDTAAACRTYNVLVSEGRNVAAALYI